jgi:hypothetical protein
MQPWFGLLLGVLAAPEPSEAVGRSMALLVADADERDQPETARPGATEEGEIDPRTRRQIFADQESESLIGTEVYLEDVPIRGKSGNGLWVGYQRRHQLFVAPIDPSSVEALTVGARIDVRGTLRRAPAPRQAAKLFALDAASTRRFAGERLYLDAWSVNELD